MRNVRTFFLSRQHVHFVIHRLLKPHLSRQNLQCGRIMPLPVGESSRLLDCYRCFQLGTLPPKPLKNLVGFPGTFVL
jgi:hypothetical protein